MCVIDTLYEAKTFFSRFKGLFAFDKLKINEGLYIKPCNSVHTFFMSYSISVIFLSENNKVIKVVDTLKPFSYAFSYGAVAVIEVLSNSVSEKIKIGDELRFI